MTNILIADDHEVTRRGIKEILREAFNTAEIFETLDFASTLNQINKQQWDLILLDIMMPNGSVLEIIHAIRAHSSTVPILILTSATETEYVIQTMKAGANGFIHKHRAVDDLLEAIKKVKAGEAYLHAETAIDLAKTLHEKKNSLLHEKLSNREFEIFRLIALGQTVKEIAFKLNLSGKTVSTYVRRIREKTNLTSYVEIARYALQNCLV
ncbi:MAG: response regulator transcription factor [Proteobacteria bacterium]|nr:response regulator transcription factor [Pseudomonadota bacterium]